MLSSQNLYLHFNVLSASLLCLDVVPKSEAKPTSHATLGQNEESDEIVEVTKKPSSISSAFFPGAVCNSIEESKNQKPKAAPSGHEAIVGLRANALCSNK